MSNTDGPYRIAAQAAYEAHAEGRPDWPSWDELPEEGQARWRRSVQVGLKAFHKARRGELKERGPKVPPIPEDVQQWIDQRYDEGGRKVVADAWPNLSPRGREGIIQAARQ